MRRVRIGFGAEIRYYGVFQTIDFYLKVFSRMKILKWIVIAAVVVAAAWGGWMYFQPKEEVSYITETVKRGDISQTVSATGEIAATNLVDVGAQVSGQIKKMHVQIGDEVKAGDLIAEIDNVTQVNEVNTKKAQLETYRAQLASAQVALKIAQRKYDRYKTLANADAVSKEEFEATEDSLATNRAKIRELQSSIKQTRRKKIWATRASPHPWTARWWPWWWSRGRRLTRVRLRPRWCRLPIWAA